MDENINSDKFQGLNRYLFEILINKKIDERPKIFNEIKI